MAFEDKVAETAKRLKELRVGRNLSHEKLASELMERYDISISKDSLINFEKSQKKHTNGMKTEYLRCFSDFYGVSADYILGITDEPIPEPDVQSICRYTGLSGATAQALHSYNDGSVERNFIRRFLDDLLEKPEKLNIIMENLWEYVDAQKKAQMQRSFDDENYQTPIIQNGYYVIPAWQAAEEFLMHAEAEVIGELSNIIKTMADEMLLSKYSKESKFESVKEFKWEIYSDTEKIFDGFFDEE